MCVTGKQNHLLSHLENIHRILIKKKNPLYFRVIRFFQKENTECTLWSKDLFWTGKEKLPSKLKIIKSKLRIPTFHVQSCYH